eukprot:GFKZ01010883.1.p1 GENE.GFKZ01010883.1~~GFKZ01010883.1.p1  ORF type:complete len:303 (+),score=15.34 GFKZ01010883.1:32-910(+)
MLSTSLHALRRGAHPRAPALAPYRAYAARHNVVRRDVLRKVKQKVDRLANQPPDPASSFRHAWRLASAAIVERYPVITPKLDPFEQQYLTDRFLARQRNARALPPDMFLSEKDILQGKKTPTFDDPYAEMYTPAPRETEADHQNDVRSLDRALDERLYLVVKRTESATHYTFPQVLATDDDITMGQYAERAFKAITEPATRPDVHFLSNSPACHLEHIYPVRYQSKHDVYGVKVFFYRAMLIEGDISGLRNCVDYMWARHTELPDAVGRHVYDAVQPVLLGPIDTAEPTPSP